MPAVLSTPAGATVIYLSSTWPWSLHASSNKMTFWSDLLSTLAQLMLLASSTLISRVEAENNFQSSTTFTPSSLAYSSIASFQSLHSHGNFSEALEHSINQSQQQRVSGSSASGTMMTTADTIGGDVVKRIFNLTSPLLASPSSMPFDHGNSNLTVTDASANNLVDCNDFTEQKLLNIVICSISDVNSNVINGTSADNSTFNDTALRNISDEYRFYNTSDGSDITGNNTSDTKNEFESTLYFIQVITTAVVLGIIILATVIGE